MHARYNNYFDTCSVTSGVSVEKESNSLSTISKVKLPCIYVAIMYSYSNYVVQHSVVPIKNCTSENEGESIYHINESLLIWICKNSEWTLFM